MDVDCKVCVLEYRLSSEVMFFCYCMMEIPVWPPGSSLRAALSVSFSVMLQHDTGRLRRWRCWRCWAAARCRPWRFSSWPRSCRARVRTRSPHQSGDAASEYADCCRVSPGRHEASPRPPCSGPLLQHRRRSAALGPAAATDTLGDWRSDRGGLVACGSVMVGVLASPGPYKAVGRNVVYQVLQYFSVT